MRCCEMGMRTGADTEVLAAGPIQGVVTRVPSGTRPVRDLVPLEPGPLEDRVGMLPPAGDVVVVHRGHLAELAPRLERCALLVGECVARHVGDAGRDDAFDRRAPRVVILARYAEDEVSAYVAESAAACELERVDRALGAVLSPEPFEEAHVERLDADAHPVD